MENAAPKHAPEKKKAAPAPEMAAPLLSEAFDLGASAGMPLFLQTASLEVNEPGDIYEQEADRAADMVMRQTDSAPPISLSSAPRIQRCGCGGMSASGGECAACREKRLGIQRKVGASLRSVQTNGGMSAPVNIIPSGGHALPASTRSHFEGRFGHDFSGVRVHTGDQAANSARSVNARAFAAGRDVVFGAGEYQPDTAAGQHLLAHELAHVVQQGGYQRRIQREDGDELSSSGLPPRAGVSASMAGLTFLPVMDSVFFAGSKTRQGLAIALYRLLGDQYQESYVDALSATGRVEWAGMGALAGEAAGGEKIDEFMIPVMESLMLIGWIRRQGLEPRINLSQLDLLRYGFFASRAWNDIHQNFASDLTDVTLPPWFTENLFRAELSSRIELLRQYIDAVTAYDADGSAESRQAVANILSYIVSEIEFNAALLEKIRADSALIDHSIYRLLWPPPRPDGLADAEKPPAAMAAENREPNPILANPFMAFMNTQPTLVNDGWVDTAARRELLDRFERYSDRTMFNVPVGDQQVTERPADANASAYPSQMGVSPALSGPPGGAQFEGSAEANYRFSMSLQFPDVFAAFGNYYYEWEYVRVPDEMIGMPVNFDDLDPESPSYTDVVGRSFRRAGRYAVEDVETVFRELGPAGVGAINLVSANAILRFVGTGIRLFFGYLTRPASETDVAFPGVGVYMVRCKAIPYQGDNPEVVRPPSVAFQPVIVRDPQELVESRVQQDVAMSQRDHDRMQELIGLLSEPVSYYDEDAMRKELDILERSLVSVGGSLEVQREQLVTYRDSLTAGSPERADAERQLERLDQIIGVRASRAEDHNLTGAEPLISNFISDEGQSIRLTMEAVNESGTDDTRTYWVSDLTTPNSSQNTGTGEDRPSAIMNAVEKILRGLGGYGRGYVSVHIDGRVYTRRITASLGSLLMEAIENVTTALAIAAVVAAPFTGGATLALLLPIGAIGAIPSAYRLINRGIDGTLRFDLETAMDIVNILGGVVGLAHAAVPMRFVNAGRALYVIGLGTDALGVLMIPAGIISQIAQLEGLPPGERAARIMEILGQAMLNVGIMVGGSLAQRARQQHMESAGAPRSLPEPTPDNRRLTTPEPIESRLPASDEPSQHPATNDPSARTRTGNPDAPSLVEGLAPDGMSRVRVTEEGRLVVCHSPCTFLEEMFPRELDTSPELRAEFDRILRITERQMRLEPQNRDPNLLRALDGRAIQLWERLEAAQLEFNRTVTYSQAQFPGQRGPLNDVQAALSHVDVAVPELAQSRAHLAEAVNDVARLQSQDGRIQGFEGWLEGVAPEAEVVATSGTRDQTNAAERNRTQEAARGVARKVGELYEARRLADQYANSPDIVVRIGQDGTVRDPITGEQLPSFDISVEQIGPGGQTTVQRRIEVQRVNGDITSHGDLRDGILHGADKIQEGLREPMRHGDVPLPPETLESTVQITWPPPVPIGPDVRQYNPDGTYTRNPRNPNESGWLPQDLLEAQGQGLNQAGAYTNERGRHVHLLSAITIVDQNGAVLWRFTNQTPGRQGRWIME